LLKVVKKVEGCCRGRAALDWVLFEVLAANGASRNERNAIFKLCDLGNK
jgi:hypothetical protein